MSNTRPTSLAEALRLARAGDPLGATRRIQSALRGADAAGGFARAAASVLDAIPTRVGGATTRPPGVKRSARVSAPEPAPGAGRFLQQRYTGEAGSLGYRLYLPPGASAGLPLVVMLHGCTQTPEDFALGTGMNQLADEHGFLVAYPGQQLAANAQRCWNWFRPEHQGRDRGEPAQIAAITRGVVAAHKADPGRVYVAGLSAGGAAAAIMATAYPDVYAAVGIHSGLACGSAHDLPSAMQAMQRGGGRRLSTAPARFVPLITFHGDRDPLVAQANSRELVRAAITGAAEPLRSRVERGRAEGGREYTRALSLGRGDRVLVEEWTVHGAGHAWSGGDRAGSHTDPDGPSASREMLRFFLEHRRGGGRC